MRCRDAKQWLAAQRDGNLAESEASKLEGHLQQCPVCRALEQRQGRLDTLLTSERQMASLLVSPPPASSTISTERIMQAVQQQRQISRQLQDIREHQQTRLARFQTVGPTLAAIIFFTLGSIPLLVLALVIIQPDLLIKALAWLNDVIAILAALMPYLQAGLETITGNNWLMASIALVFVLMMGVWLRLMRYPQEA
jgi:predicted anti-sigma-YlaC factor YlaD